MVAATINTTVTGLQGRPLANTAPTVNQAVGWNGTSWLPQGPFLPLTGGTLTGNVVTSGNIHTTGGSVQSTGNPGTYLNGAGVNIVSGRAAVNKSSSVQFSTTNTSLTMVGVGAQFTPRVSGIVLLFVSTQIAVGSASTACNGGLFIGTGTPPSPGAAQTGNSPGFGTTFAGNPYTAGMWVPWSQGAVFAGLTVGTQYWFDYAISNTGAAGTIYTQWSNLWVGEI